MREHLPEQKAARFFRALKSASSGLVGMVMGAALLLAGPGAQAAPLGLVLQDTPDILVNFMSVGYNAAGQSLTAQGLAAQLDNASQPISNGAFNLAAVVNNDGTLQGGAVAIAGTIASLGFNSGTLLTGTLTDFGFPATGNPLEFLFTVTGGDAAALYGGVSSVAGILMGDTGFAGDFTGNWASAPLNAVADVAPIPLPAAAWLFGSALLGLAGVARRRAAP